MHARQLVEVAALLASHGPVLIEGPGVLSTSALQDYWATSKCRCQRWLAAVKRLASAEAADPEQRAKSSAEIRPLLEEIFLAEMVLRVWTAILYAYDRRRGISEAEPIAQNVLVSHLEVRTRALVLLVHSPLLAGEEAVLLNRMRRRMERWTDLLLGHLHADYDVAELGFDAARVVEFATDLGGKPQSANHRKAWGLTLAALRLAFERGLADVSPNPSANHDIAASVLACFPAGLFESTGMLRSLWLVRLTRSADDAQGLIADLLDPAPSRGASRDELARVDGPARRRF
jgi:hypothetical protein